MEYQDVDRAPWLGINLYGGNYDSDPTGSSWTVADLMQTVDEARPSGWRRYLFLQPNGDVPRRRDAGGVEVNFVRSVVQFHSLNQAKEAEVQNVLGPWWLANHAADSGAGIYSGFMQPLSLDLDDPCLGEFNPIDAVTCPLEVPTQVPDMGNSPSRAFEVSNWGVWVAACLGAGGGAGAATGLRICDNASTNAHYDGLTSLRAAFTEGVGGWMFGTGVKVKVGGEGIVNDSHLPDQGRIEDGPYFAIESFVLSHEASAGQSWNGLIDPKSSQVLLGFQSDTTATRATIRARMAGGFVCVAMNTTEEVEAAILDLGTVPDVVSASAQRAGAEITLTWVEPEIFEDDGVTPVEVAAVRVWARATEADDWTLLSEETDGSYVYSHLAAVQIMLTVWTEYNGQSPGVILEIGTGDGGFGGDTEEAQNSSGVRPRGRVRGRRRGSLKSVSLERS